VKVIGDLGIVSDPIDTFWKDRAPIQITPQEIRGT
jgi:hypothetical protein